MIPIFRVSDNMEGYAFLVIDYSQEHNLLFTCAMDNGEIWTLNNKEIRFCKNISLDRKEVKKMTENTKGDSTRYKAKEWPLKEKDMKNYVVGILSMYENDLKLFKVQAEDKYEALKKGMVDFTSEEYKEHEIEFQNGAICPPNFESLTGYYEVGEIITNVIEI